MSSCGMCLGKGKLYWLNESTGEWEELCQVVDKHKRLVETQKYQTMGPSLTKKQAKRLLKHEKNPMARKELQRILSGKGE